MKIKSTTIIKHAEKETALAIYSLEYSIINGTLTRVHAGINEVSEGNPETYIGSITYENGQIGCTLPEHVKISEYFEDFEAILVQIKSDASS